MPEPKFDLEVIRDEMRKLPDNAPVVNVHGAIIGLCDHLIVLRDALAAIAENFGERTVVLRTASETNSERITALAQHVEDLRGVLGKTVTEVVGVKAVVTAVAPGDAAAASASSASSASADVVEEEGQSRGPSHDATPMNPNAPVAADDDDAAEPPPPPKILTEKQKADLERLKKHKEEKAKLQPQGAK